MYANLCSAPLDGENGAATLNRAEVEDPLEGGRAHTLCTLKSALGGGGSLPGARPSHSRCERRPAAEWMRETQHKSSLLRNDARHLST